MKASPGLLVPPAVAATALATYAATVRPRLLRWGATPLEVRGALPGDELVPHARYVATRAVTVQAAPALVWPWLVQMGQGRGGLYSYDRLENLMGCDIHSVERIVPELQQLEIGDAIRLVPEDAKVPLALHVAILDPGRALVLRTPDAPPAPASAHSLPVATWAFVLREHDAGETRLLVRWRSAFEPTLRGRLTNQYLLEPVHFVMERKMMLGIRARAEGQAACGIRRRADRRAA